MQLVVQGQNNPARTEHVTADVMRRRTGRSRQGFFLDNGTYFLTSDGSTLTITFNPQILILEGLDPATEAQIVTEEAQHETDFHRVERRMERALRAAIQAGESPNIDDYWAWYIYYISEARTMYHQQVGNPDTVPLVMPRSAAPF